MDENQNYNVEETELPETCRVAIDRKKAGKLSGIMRFVGIMLLLGGIPEVLSMSLITIPIGVLMILAGIKIFEAGGNLKDLCRGNESMATYAAENLANGFKNYGIATIISLAGVALAILLLLILVPMIIAAIGLAM